MQQLTLSLPLTSEELREKAKAYVDEHLTKRSTKPFYRTISVGNGDTFVFAHYPQGHKKNQTPYGVLIARIDNPQLAALVKEHLESVADAYWSEKSEPAQPKKKAKKHMTEEDARLEQEFEQEQRSAIPAMCAKLDRPVPDNLAYMTTNDMKRLFWQLRAVQVWSGHNVALLVRDGNI